MTGAPSRWTCDKCNETVAMTHKGHHRKYRCHKQGNLLRSIQRQEKAIVNEAARAAERVNAAEVTPMPPTYFQYLHCLCTCGTRIGQVRGQLKKQFVDHDHYDAWRRAAAKNAAGGNVDLVGDRKHAEEVAAVAAKNEALQREAAAIVLLTPEASYALWGACLDVTL